MVSRWKKSAASMPCAWLRGNTRQVVPAGGVPDRGRPRPGCGGSWRRRDGGRAGGVRPGCADGPSVGFLCEADDQVADVRGDRWTAGPVRVGPLLGCDTKSHIASELAEWRADDAGS